ncbi:hypothetical protein BP6252_06806 [Coleophoma cylindrospora]|uniref:Uncharacterized protein n=1 Tax=Coleophoma cylindrospora TaxID=1849047 RepID=A0A3D8RFS3_9HELO|nr:hypothetical protein BP6252_06806 [Coleophoma cylindrospora]
MFSTNVVSLALLAVTALVNAAPLVSPVNSTALNGTGLNSTTWQPGYILKPHEVILFGEDRMEVMHVDAYKALLAEHNIFHVDTQSLEPLVSANLTIGEFEDDEALEKRGACLYRTNTVTDTTQHFVGWDVQMSPVVRANGPRTTITVTQGYTITNAITVGISGDWTIVKDALKAAFKVDYQRSWSSSYSAAIAAEITPGYAGTMVSKPWTTRRYGRVLKGCVGAQKVSSNFMADSFDQGQHAGISWVAGTIELCQKKEARLTRCTGAGYFA